MKNKQLPLTLGKLEVNVMAPNTPPDQEILKIFKPFTKPKHPNFQGIHFDAHGITATNGHFLMHLQTQTPTRGVFLPSGEVADGRFPNYKELLDQLETDHHKALEVNLKKLLEELNHTHLSNTYKGEVGTAICLVAYAQNLVFYDVDYLKRIVKLLSDDGVQQATFKFKKAALIKSQPLLIESVFRSQKAIFVLMPVAVYETDESIWKRQKNILYSLEKNAKYSDQPTQKSFPQTNKTITSMTNNAKWLQANIAPKTREDMPHETLQKSYDTFQKFTQNWTDYSVFERSENIERTLGVFREKYTEAMSKMPPAPKAEAKPPMQQPKADKKPKAATPKAKDCKCEEEKPKAEVKPKADKKASSKVQKPKADKKPSHSEKQEEKAKNELKRLKSENAQYEKKILFDSDFLSSLIAQINKHEQKAKGLGALPTKLVEELKRERTLNTLYKRVDKRNVKGFQSLEKRLKKSNELTPKLEQQFYALYSTLGGLKQATVAKRQVRKTKTNKRKKTTATKKSTSKSVQKQGFWERIFG
ncbi:hypothetical protein P1X15_10840 [Runella sp. MFBS21]|uniref:hypothetical protein n=1 Tax=Runella sp. MFBS21 TaxID=3034018 RepID=UPI0023F895B6|nr:hypothetical protein [Runella sp. MFBS21]MDF7818096.1 hypothetical protein [Runella sp. MFBS21]